jgi:hypothetical protein
MEEILRGVEEILRGGAESGYQGISSSECQRCHKVAMGIRVALKIAVPGPRAREKSWEWVLCPQCADELMTLTLGYAYNAPTS